MTRHNLLTASAIAATLLFAQAGAFGQATTTTVKKVEIPAHTDTVVTTTSTKKSKVKAHKESAEELQLREMRESLMKQQTQIDSLQQQLATKSADAATAQQTATDAQAQAAAAAASAASAAAAASAASTKVDSVSSSVTDLKSTTAGLTDTVLTSQKKVEEEINSPSTIHYKGITIQPVAFAAAEGVYRQHSVNSDINTPFNAIPFPSSNEGHVSELNFSGRQSRLGVLFSGDAGNYKLSGYYEMDFLGTGVTSNNNQSNSYVLRQRQIWGQVALKSGFTMTGGQMWSLVTEDRKGTDARTEIQPNTIDPQYLVGYTWTRQPGFRVQQRFGDYKTGAFTIAAAAEQAQITNFTAANIAATEFYFGGIGQAGGLYNAAGNIGNNNTASTGGITTYANNVVPDLMVKAAVDYPKFHFEVGGLARFMRDYYFPVTYNLNGTTLTESYATTEKSNTATAGGVFGAARVYLGKFAEVAVQGTAGTGVGRYGSTQLADATLRPDETLEPIKNYHGMFSLETHPMPKLDVFAYYGGEYNQRTVYALPNGTLTGYGPQTLNNSGCYNSPTAAGISGNGAGGSLATTGTCQSPTRYIQEPMVGFIYRAWSSPKYGRLQYWVTYSYLQRNLWSGSGGQPSLTTPTGPRATDPMVHISMRYYIP